MKMLKVTDHGDVRYVPDFDDGDDTQTTALAKPVDVQRITQDAIGANVEMVNQVLRQYATPTAPTGYRNPQPIGVSSRDELDARNTRFKWTIVAVVVLSAVTALGIVLVAQRAMELDTVATVAGWLVLSGLGGYASATWVHSRESALTPEALEGERIAGDYDIAAVDAESRQIIARAFARSIENDSETKRANAEAQRLANLSLLNQPKPTQAPQRARATFYDESDLDDYEQPVCAPVAPTMATWELAQDEGFQPIKPAQPSEALRNLLQAVREIYADCERRNSDTITSRLPWSARGEWAARDKERARAVLESFDPALIEAGDGGRYRLNRQWSQADAELKIIKSWR
jgi:hypothetical protein